MSNQYPPPPGQPQWRPAGTEPVPPPKRRSPARTAVIIIASVVVGLIVFTSCLALMFTGGTGNAPTDPETIPVPTTESTPNTGNKPAGPKAKEAPPALSQNGTWLVPSEMKPGTYRSGNGPTCYWARLKGTSGNFEDIIINGNGPNQTVTILPTDKAFEHARCEGWKLIPAKR